MIKQNPNVTIAPWAKIEVANLEAVQKKCAPYQCPYCNTALVPTKAGWNCINCDYDRDWAFVKDADGSAIKKRKK